jgi:carbonic anhydrase/acetyltransferase-like protein (isoleucine patch superfamily)
VPLILPYRGATPRIAADAYVAHDAVITGDTVLGPQSSVWFGVVIRADSAPVRIGMRSNIQDGALIHEDAGASTTIGDDVTIGHKAIVHGATVCDGALIGMGAIVLTGAVIGAGSVVAAGAVVPEGAFVEPGSVVMGIPAKPRGEMSETVRAHTIEAARHYARLAREYPGGMIRGDRLPDAGGTGEG